MVSKEVIDWIKSQESQGYSYQQIYSSLTQQGYNPNEINEALNLVSQGQTVQQTSSPKKGISISSIIIIGIIIVAIIGGGIFWFMSQDKKIESEIIHSNVDKTDDLIDTQGNKVGDINTKIEADLNVTSDCGGMDCFKEKFSQCIPSTVTSKLMDNLIYYYEIIGPKNGLCEVMSKFTANPNPEWVDKEMTCSYDNTKDFETAVQDMSKCKGPLYILMTGG